MTTKLESWLKAQRQPELTTFLSQVQCWMGSGRVETAYNGLRGTDFCQQKPGSNLNRLGFRGNRAEAKRCFATLLNSQLRSNILEDILNPWSEMLLTLLEVLTQLPIKNLFEKVKFRQVPVIVSYSRSLSANHVFLVWPFYSPIFKIWAVNNAEMNHTPPTVFHTRWLKKTYMSYIWISQKSGCC